MKRQRINFSRYARQIQEINDHLTPQQKIIQSRVIDKICNMLQMVGDGADHAEIEPIKMEIAELQRQMRP